MRNRDRSTLRRALRLSTSLAAAMAVLTLGGAAGAASPVRCVSLDVPAPMILPDGSVHPAGELKLCLDRNFNPVAGLHKVYIDRMPVGFLVSRISNAEIPGDSSPTVLFYGSLAGRLRLVGYTFPANGKSFSYLLWNAHAARGAMVAAGPGGVDDGLASGPSSGVLLAARLE